MEVKRSVNIIYITNDCNLNCDYCYQKDERNNSLKVSIEDDEIKKVLYKVKDEEPGVISTVVLFGGEAFLHPEKVFYAFEIVNELKQKFNKDIALSCTTNGIWFLNDNNFERYKNEVKKLNQLFSLEISYDGSGHFRRVDKSNNNTKQRVQSILQKFKDNNLKVTIRYTIHKDNYKNFLKDILKIIKFYEGTKLLEKIVVSFFHSELEKIKVYSEVLVKELKEPCQYIYEKFGVPVCELSCGSCKECDVGCLKDIKYYSNNKEKIQDKQTLGSFEF